MQLRHVDRRVGAVPVLVARQRARDPGVVARGVDRIAQRLAPDVQVPFVIDHAHLFDGVKDHVRCIVGVGVEHAQRVLAVLGLVLGQEVLVQLRVVRRQVRA